MGGNADGFIAFIVITGVLAFIWMHEQAKIDRIREESRQRISDWKADFERRLDEFQTANPTASCRNCLYGEHGACRVAIRAPRHFCTQWFANDEHSQALRMKAMTDDEILAEMGDAEQLASNVKAAEQYLAGPVVDSLLREQGRRFLLVARRKLARIQQGAQSG